MKLLTFLFLILSGVAGAQNQPAAAVATGKIGFLDVDNLVSQLPEYKQLQTRLQTTRQQMSDKLFEKQQAFQRSYAYYMQNANTLADTTKTRLETELQQMDTDIQQFRADAENTFENTKKLVLGPLYLKLGGVLREVAAENGFIMILPYRVGSGEFLLHTDEKLDVSPYVLKKLTAGN